MTRSCHLSQSHVTCHPKKLVRLLAITCEIVRDIKILNNTAHIARLSMEYPNIIQYIFNERKLVLWLAHVRPSVRPSPQKTCEIVTNYYDFSMNVRDIKILNNTTKYCLIFHRIAQYRPVLFHIVQYSSILSNNVQYFPILFNIVHVAILALSCPSCYIVMTIKHCLILSSISLHSPVLTNIGKWCPLYMFFALDL